MWAVKQNVFLILNNVPVTFVTDPELIRNSVPGMAHFLYQEIVAREAKARKCTAEVAGKVFAKVERQHRFVISFFVIPPSRISSQRYAKMSVICPHNSA